MIQSFSRAYLVSLCAPPTLVVVSATPCLWIHGENLWKYCVRREISSLYCFSSALLSLVWLLERDGKKLSSVCLFIDAIGKAFIRQPWKLTLLRLSSRHLKIFGSKSTKLTIRDLSNGPTFSSIIFQSSMATRKLSTPLVTLVRRRSKSVDEKYEQFSYVNENRFFSHLRIRLVFFVFPRNRIK